MTTKINHSTFPPYPPSHKILEMSSIVIRNCKYLKCHATNDLSTKPSWGSCDVGVYIFKKNQDQLHQIWEQGSHQAWKYPALKRNVHLQMTNGYAFGLYGDAKCHQLEFQFCKKQGPLVLKLLLESMMIHFRNYEQDHLA